MGFRFHSSTKVKEKDEKKRRRRKGLAEGRIAGGTPPLGVQTEGKEEASKKKKKEEHPPSSSCSCWPPLLHSSRFSVADTTPQEIQILLFYASELSLSRHLFPVLVKKTICPLHFFFFFAFFGSLRPRKKKSLRAVSPCLHISKDI